MRLLSWLRWLNRGPRPRPSFRPCLEALEGRLPPAAHTWTGGADGLWSNPANWAGGAPAPGESNLTLLFPTGANNLVNNNDLAGLRVRSIAFTGSGYRLLGNPVTLGPGGITHAFVVGMDTISLGMALSGGLPLTVSHAAATLKLDGALSGPGGLSKAGPGRVILNAANSYAGATTVAAGVLVIQSDTALGGGAAGTSVLGGASLLLQGPLVVAEPLTLLGGGFKPLGALSSQSGGNNWLGPISLGGTPTGPGVNITVDNDVLQLRGVVRGKGGLTKSGAGVLALMGPAPNTYLGTTRVNGGTLQLIKPAGVTAVPHALVVGDALDGLGADRVQIYANDQIADQARVTVAATGELSLNGGSEAIGSLTMLGGGVQSAADTLTLNGNLALTGVNVAASISARLNLGAVARTVTVAANSTLHLLAEVSGGGGLTKAGPGRLNLTASNSYAGLTTVSGGVLAINSDHALGSAAAGTTVGNGGTLQLGELIDTVTESLTLSGAGFAGRGALDYVSAGFNPTSTWAGTITLLGSAAVGNHAGLFSALALDCVIQGSGGLTIVGPSPVWLEGNSANTYLGVTRVNGGLLLLDKTGGVPAIPHDLIVGGGVSLVADDQIADGATVTISKSGHFGLADHDETIRQLLMLGGSLTTGQGSLTITP